MDELAYKSSTVQLENYTQYNLYGSKIEKKIGSMNGLCHFFYILELKLGNIYFTTTVIQQNHIGVKKLHDSPLRTHH